MVMVIMHQHYHSTAPSTHPINPPPPSSVSALRSPNTSTSNTQQFPLIGSPSVEHGLSISRVKLSDIVPYDRAPVGPYLQAVEVLSGSLMRHNDAVIELGGEGTSVLRCGLESVRYFFKTRVVAQNGGASTGGAVLGKSGRGIYIYRARRLLEDMDSSPPCMTEDFRCMGRAARAALCAIASVFDHLLDDNMLPVNKASSSVVVATFSNTTSQNGKGAIGGGKLVTNGEVKKGLLTLVCDPNGRWYLADSGLTPGDLLLLTEKISAKTTLAFRLIPQSNAILDYSPITAAGHVIPQSYVQISNLSAEEDMLCSNTYNAYVARDNLNKEPSLRSVLSDPLFGTFLEDAMFVSCRHSFGGLMLKRVIDMARCTLCNAEIERSSLIPNHVLRAVAAAVKHEDDQRLFHNAALRKRRKEVGDIRVSFDFPHFAAALSIQTAK
ncbi:hypothetical protein R3W88_029577 [Solanum pinnatisectum]|uniref:Uncharacterized protein n=1 Tax=Solanum pinnatisectum TaxID=50273 RepID=A0AAV9K5X3_9SOLN|nr:hypothetical protein R3W88_029577 [Solanum pinnatisectum]